MPTIDQANTDDRMNTPETLASELISHRSVRPGLDRRATRVMANARLRSALRSIALDVLGLCDPRDLPQEMAAYVERATETAVSAVSDTSMAALLESIEAAIVEAPPSVVARLEQAATRRDTGID